MRRLHGFFLVCLALILPGSLERAAADDALEAIPGKTAMVVRFPGLQQFSGKLSEMLQAIHPLAAQTIPSMESELPEMLIEEEVAPTLDPDAPIYLIVSGSPTNSQPTVMVTPKDVAAFRNHLVRLEDGGNIQFEELKNGVEKLTAGERTMYVAMRGKQFIYSRSEKLVELLDFKSDQSFAKLIDAADLADFNAGDAAIAVNAAYLVETYQTEIDQARKAALEGVDALPDEQLGAAPETSKALYRDALTFAFDSLKDVRYVVGRANFSAQGGKASAIVRVVSGSPTDKLLAAHPARVIELLDLLPEKHAMYFAAALDVEYLQKLTANMDWTALGLNKELVEKSMKLTREAGVEAMAAAYNLPTDSKSGIQAVAAQQAKHPAKLLEAARVMGSEKFEVDAKLYKQKLIEYKADGEDYKGQKIDLTVLGIEMGNDPNDPSIEQVAGLMKYIFGGEQLQIRGAVVDQLYLQVVGNSSEAMHRTLDGLTSGEGVLGVEASFGKTRDQLPKESNVLAIVDMPKLVIDSVKMLKKVEPFSLIFAAAPINVGFQPPATYSGFSAGATDHGVRFDLFVPVEQPRGIIQTFAPGM